MYFDIFKFKKLYLLLKRKYVIQIFIILLVILMFFILFNKNLLESFSNTDSNLERNIFLLWLQGWENAPWFNKQVAESWEINNPGWKIHYIDSNNLKDYIPDIDYLYDEKRNITPQAKSDIIRINLLNKYGGVWADATLLCMQPLDNWVHSAIKPSGFWMYHGNGAKMPVEIGPASWFIISQKNNYIINKWKYLCDEYWNSNEQTYGYFWMDELFKNAYNSDNKFKEIWSNVPYINCEEDGQAHTLAKHGMQNDTPHIKKLFLEKPPYALKLWKTWNGYFPDVNTEKCKNSNGYYAIQLSKRK